ncbi:MAG: hypothetical protein ING75_03950 [Rhodocyclaceae bacterium]|nr:hypothetical protein [Rhodocyclaceae bacterium]
MELRPIVAPTTTASFSPDTVAAGGVSSLTFTVNHANAYPLSNATFSVTLPANVSIASDQISGTCVGTTTTPALTVGATNVSFSVPSLPSAGCTVVAQVSSGAVGSFNVASSGVTTAQTPVAGAAGTGATLTATTTVLPPVISLGFSPEWIASGGTSTVTYTVSSQSRVALQNAAFSHTLNNLTVANTTIGGTCSGVTATPALWVGATSVSLNIATLPSSGCTVTIGVSSTVLGYHANATSAVTASGVSGSGSPSQTDFLTVVQSAAGIFYVHTDHLGTPRAITDPSDNRLVWRWKNDDPFGNNTPDENPSGTNTSAFKYNLRFPGQYYDQETNTNYNYFRDYDPSTGRYVQSDPIGLAGGISTYAYVSGNPMSFIDPYGLIRYNAPAPRTVPLSGRALEALQCTERCLQRVTGDSTLDLLITGGAEKTGHSKNSHHKKGEACDIAGPRFHPGLTDSNVMTCAASCGFGAGQFESFADNPNRDHWHLQLTPGNGVPAISPPPPPIPQPPTSDSRRELQFLFILSLLQGARR